MDRLFKRIVKELKKIDIIGNLDLDNVGAYCNAFSCYVKVTMELSEETKEKIVITKTSFDTDGKAESTKKMINGAVIELSKLQKQYAEEMRKFAALCGLTIDSRLKVATCKVEKQEDNIKSKFGI